MNKNYYAIIPANIRYDKDLTPNAKLLYGEITALANEKGYCWANNGYFAKLYGVSKETVSRWITNLEKKGYIATKVIYKEGTKEIKERRIYMADAYPIDENINAPIEENINTPIDENIKGYRQKGQDPIDENVNTPIDENIKDNNTVFNTTVNNTVNNTTTTTNNSDSSFKENIDPEFRELAALYQKCGFRTNALTPDWINEIRNEYGFEWVKNAFIAAEKNGKLSKSYVEGILQNWQKGGGMKLCRDDTKDKGDITIPDYGW